MFRVMFKVDAYGVKKKIVQRLYPCLVVNLAPLGNDVIRKIEELRTDKHRWFSSSRDAHKYFSGLKS